jgi:hypothetical protein
VTNGTTYKNGTVASWVIMDVVSGVPIFQVLHDDKWPIVKDVRTEKFCDTKLIHILGKTSKAYAGYWGDQDSSMSEEIDLTGRADSTKL